MPIKMLTESLAKAKINSLSIMPLKRLTKILETIKLNTKSSTQRKNCFETFPFALKLQFRFTIKPKIKPAIIPKILKRISLNSLIPKNGNPNSLKKICILKTKLSTKNVPQPAKQYLISLRESSFFIKFKKITLQLT